MWCVNSNRFPCTAPFVSQIPGLEANRDARLLPNYNQARQKGLLGAPGGSISELPQPIGAANQGFGDGLRQEGVQSVKGSLQCICPRIPQRGATAFKNTFDGFDHG